MAKTSPPKDTPVSPGIRCPLTASPQESRAGATPGAGAFVRVARKQPEPELGNVALVREQGSGQVGVRSVAVIPSRQERGCGISLHGHLPVAGRADRQVVWQAHSARRSGSALSRTG